MFDIVIERLQAYRDNPGALKKISDLLNQIDIDEQNKLRRANYAANFVREGADHQHYKFLALIENNPKTYGPDVFVPDPFEDLESNGLAYCSFGGEVGRLRSRTLTITSAGSKVLADIKAQVAA